MVKYTKYSNIILIFIAIFIFKSVLTFLTSSPTAFSDNYAYLKTAWAIFNNHSLYIYDGTISKFSPLYPLLLSFLFILKDMSIIYIIIKVLNAFIISLSIFPIYFIAKDFLSEKRSLFIAFLSSLITSFLLYPNYILAENLFFPLVLFAFYFIYLSLTRDKLIYFLLSGLFIFLSILTKPNGMGMVPIMFVTYLFIKEDIKFVKIIFHYFILAITIMPYIIWRYTFESSLYYKEGLLSKLVINLTSNIIVFVNWIINYAGYALLSIGVILGVYFIGGIFIKKSNNLKVLFLLSLFSSIFFIIIAANHSSVTLHNPIFKYYSYKPIGRYIAGILPFIILTGFIICKKQLLNNKIITKSVIISAIILLISTQLTLSHLFPINNSELTLFGIAKYITNFILYNQISYESAFQYGGYLALSIIIISLPFFALIFKNNKVYIFTFLFLISTFLLAFSIHLWNIDKYWTENNQEALAKWTNRNIDPQKMIAIDTKYCNLSSKEEINQYLCYKEPLHSSIVGFWLNNPITLNKTISDCIITQDKEVYGMKNLKSKGNFNLFCREEK